jgi:hypothetical protein
LPGVEKWRDQRFQRLGARLEREEAPMATFLKGARPGVAGARSPGPDLGPGLALQGRQHAGLSERGFADAGIAEQDGQPVRIRGERGQHLDGLALPAEEEIGVRLGHGGEAAIGRGIAPKLSRSVAAAGSSFGELRYRLLGRRIGADDPMQLAQERQAGC